MFSTVKTHEREPHTSFGAVDEIGGFTRDDRLE